MSALTLPFPIISIMIFLPILGSLLTLLSGRVSPKAPRVISFIISLAVLALALYSYSLMLVADSGAQLNYVEGPIPWIPALKGLDYYVAMDALSAVLVLISAFLSVLVVLGSWDLIKEREAPYYMLVLLFEGSIIGVFTAMNLILFYVFWELVLIPMFFFIGIWGGPKKKFAAMKFFIYTHLGGAIMLLGFLALYLLVPPHTFNMPELVGRVPFWVQVIATAAVFWGFAVKLPVVPLHTWLPDAHVEAPAPISVFLAGLLLKMGGYGFIRINVGLLPDASRAFALLFIALGILTMFYGALVAMMQRDLKRMIALTSINHMGFVLLGSFTANTLGLSGAIFQMFNHAAAIGILFMLSGYIHEQAGTREIPLLRGMKDTMPKTATLLVLGAMAAMGVPVYSSFLSEFMVIVGAISVNVAYAIVILIPIITVAYFLWMMRRCVISKAVGAKGHDLSRLSTISLSLYLLPLVLLIIFPSLLLGLVDPLSAELVRMLRGG